MVKCNRQVDLREIILLGVISAYEKVNKTFIYYGDLSNKLLKNAGKKYSMKVDTADRRKMPK